ncbi:4-(cytidine 5'-diphospho)-2-C-methyl-D-erythritol kinase [Streptococcus sp. H31]|uniref:4-(cytidine 5'-diphospho)-2-C-methyl-D-erythritol kinase n=1 Tax=Streptococcus huangxiaojuni TaxID=3237239 RepID=UPI0034A45DEE
MLIIEKAPAKINLGLDIVGKRNDGYHELSMLMASVDLNDYISISEIESDDIIIESNSHRMPVNEKNDVYKAASLLKERYAIQSGVKILLEKRIPICAGLGGGSTDAAATLRALNRFWNLGLSCEKLQALGFEIGSDVPYCIQGGYAAVSGKGDIVEPLAVSISPWVVLVKPDFGVSTPTVFKAINTSISRVNISYLRAAAEAGDYQQMLHYMGNSLEDITITRRPFIQKIKDRLMKCGADTALMTGSGPTVFALCQSEKKADRLVNSMKGFCRQVYKVRVL